MKNKRYINGVAAAQCSLYLTEENLEFVDLDLEERGFKSRVAYFSYLIEKQMQQSDTMHRIHSALEIGDKDRVRALLGEMIGGPR